MKGTSWSPSSMRSKPSSIAFLEMWSYAPTPSMEMMVASGSTSVMDCNMCATLAPCFGRQSVLERRCGNLNLLRNLFRHRSCHHPPQYVADHYHTSIRFAESCDASNLMVSMISSGTFPTAKQDPTWASRATVNLLPSREQGRGGLTSCPTDLVLHLVWPCANTSRTPTHPTRN